MRADSIIYDEEDDEESPIDKLLAFSSSQSSSAESDELSRGGGIGTPSERDDGGTPI